MNTRRTLICAIILIGLMSIVAAQDTASDSKSKLGKEPSEEIGKMPDLDAKLDERAQKAVKHDVDITPSVLVNRVHEVVSWKDGDWLRRFHVSRSGIYVSNSIDNCSSL